MNDAVRAFYLGDHFELLGTQVHGRLQTSIFGDDRALLALESSLVTGTFLVLLGVVIGFIPKTFRFNE